MRSQKRGGPPALPPDDTAVTYSRIEDAPVPFALGDEPMADGFAETERREPVFTAVRVDPPRRRERVARVELDEFDDGPIALDPEALGAAMPPPRRPRRRRSPVLRVVLLIGAIAVLGGIGVLGATAMKVLYGGQAQIAKTAPDSASLDSASPASQATASTVDPTAVPVDTPESVLPDSGSAGPGVLAIPANEAAPIDMTPAAPRSEAALSPVPPPAPEPAPVVAAPEPRPLAKAPESPAPKAPERATATTEAPPLPAPAPVATAPVATAPMAIAPATGTDAQIDSALSDVDRLIAAKKAPATAPTGEAAIAPPQATLALPADQSAALAITPPAATILPPPLPAPATTGDSTMPVPPADIPDASN